MDREEFVKQYRREVKPIDPNSFDTKAKQDRARARNKAIERERYSAKKGTMARAKKRKRKIRNSIVTLILASAVGIGGLTVVGHLRGEKESPNITQIAMENAIGADDLGISEDTMEKFKKYDEFFSNFDKNDTLTDEMVLAMSKEIEGMNYAVVKEKMANLLNEDVENIKLHYSFEKSDGKFLTTITVNEDNITKEQIFTGNKNLIMPESNTIPKPVENVITQLNDFENLNSDLKEDKITKVNAVKKLQKLYKNIADIASSEFIKDERGNITLVHYEKVKEQAQNKEERDEQRG